MARSHEAPLETFRVNALGAVNLCAVVRAVAPKARVLLVGLGCEDNQIDRLLGRAEAQRRADTLRIKRQGQARRRAASQPLKVSSTWGS